MAQEYKMPKWKKWSSIYCARCFRWLGNYKGWYQANLELYCRKCTKEIMEEQQTNTQESQS